MLDGVLGSFGLAIVLRMICGGEGESRAEMLMEGLLKGTDRPSVTVGHNGFGQYKELKDVRDEGRCKGWSVNIRGGGDEVRIH